jgi:hypothetical protein
MNIAVDINEQIKKELAELAINSIFYVAFGQVMRREIAQKFNISEKDARIHIDGIAVQMADYIRREYSV